MHAELEKQAHTDPLTGALNRRAMLELFRTQDRVAAEVSQALARAATDAAVCSCLMAKRR